MPFIKRNTAVQVTGGRYAGSHGFVRDFLVSQNKTKTDYDTMALVEFWHGEGGKFLSLLFRVEELEVRQVKPMTREIFERMSAAYELEQAAA